MSRSINIPLLRSEDPVELIWLRPQPRCVSAVGSSGAKTHRKGGEHAAFTQRLTILPTDSCRGLVAWIFLWCSLVLPATKISAQQPANYDRLERAADLIRQQKIRDA